MKTELTIEESAKLIELGIDAKLASKERFFVGEYERAEYFDKIEKLTGKRILPKGVFQKREKAYMNGPTSWNIYHKVFSLTDILSILPKEIGNYELNISANKYKYFASYVLWVATDIRDILSFNQFSASELIDALNSLLIWCLTEKKINFNTEKK